MSNYVREDIRRRFASGGLTREIHVVFRGLKFEPVEAKRRSRSSGTQISSIRGRFVIASFILSPTLSYFISYFYQYFSCFPVYSYIAYPITRSLRQVDNRKKGPGVFRINRHMCRRLNDQG